ncbi:hypothetical protein SACC_24860 [Saccharolobus caldissimus]|uniref:Uncharacterized protein n=1 Tax=Saccharolobus caldissimus TaxID=1702097 RepID=A0AAQ4CUI8_9CREN|nr:hypothetical protein SACC_24860 [Saccharolobus caldissimus]
MLNNVKKYFNNIWDDEYEREMEIDKKIFSELKSSSKYAP